MDANPVLTKALCLLASPHLLIKTLFKRRAIRGSVLVLADNPTVPQRKDLPKKNKKNTTTKQVSNENITVVFHKEHATKDFAIRRQNG